MAQRWQALPLRLRQALGLTALVSALAWGLPDGAAVVEAVPVGPRAPNAGLSPNTPRPPAFEPAAGRALPARPVGPQVVSDAVADPFGASGALSTQGPSQSPPAAPMANAEPMGPPPLVLPSPSVRVQGWLRAADGAPVLLISDGETDWVARPGLALPGGLEVQAIERDALRLKHVATGRVQRLPLPATWPQSAPHVPSAPDAVQEKP